MSIKKPTQLRVGFFVDPALLLLVVPDKKTAGQSE
jgi:hypothetical protein